MLLLLVIFQLHRWGDHLHQEEEEEVHHQGSLTGVRLISGAHQEVSLEGDAHPFQSGHLIRPRDGEKQIAHTV